MRISTISSNKNILIEFLNFRRPAYWLSGFAKGKDSLPDYDIVINATLISEEPKDLGLRVQGTFQDGKWVIVWSRADEIEALSWTLPSGPTVVAMVISRFSKERQQLEIRGPDETFCGKLLRYFIVAPQIIAGDLVYLHASAIVRNGGCALIIGPRGSGKTTYTYAAFRHGWSVIAEDFVLVRPKLQIEEFFPSVEWECRIRPEDAQLIDGICGVHSIQNAEYRGSLDDRGRMTIFPQGRIEATRDRPIVISILLDSALASYSDLGIRIGQSWLYNDLMTKRSLSAACILYGKDFNSICEAAKPTFSLLENRVPAHLVERSGDLRSDLLSFLQLLDSLEQGQ